MLLKAELKAHDPSPGNWIVLDDGTVLVCTSRSDGGLEGFDGAAVRPEPKSVLKVLVPKLVPIAHERDRLGAIIDVATDLAAVEIELHGNKLGLARTEVLREARFLKSHLERLRASSDDPSAEVIRLRTILADACYHAEFVADMPLPAQSARARKNLSRLRKRAEILNRMRCDLGTIPPAPHRSFEDLEELVAGLIGAA